MRELTVGRGDQQQRLDKYLFRIFSGAPRSFVYKMLRKKNIKVNGAKADPALILQEGDVITLYLSDDTFNTFSGAETAENREDTDRYRTFFRQNRVRILYEDSSMIALDKPAGLFSQPQDNDLSAAEWLLGYLMDKGELDQDRLSHFRPSPCHRLDRNTSGVLLCAKDPHAARLLSEMFRARAGTKLYRVVTAGELPAEGRIEGVLVKDAEKDRFVLQEGDQQDKGYSLTRYRRLWYNGKVSCAEAELVTGRTHQIRSHMAAAGHPVIGDGRYGDAEVNRQWKKMTGNRLMLHCHKILLPPAVTEYMGPADGVIESPVPEVFDRFRKEI